MPAMGWRESVSTLFGEGGCLPWIGKKGSKELYSYPIKHEKREGSAHPAAEEVITVEVPEVPLRELNEITNFFSNERLIGQGSYAKVYRVLMHDARPAVVKKLEKPSKHASNVVFLKQLGVASRLKHENFVRLLGYTINRDLRVLVYEYATMGTLHDVLHGPMDAPTWGEEEEAGRAPAPVLSWFHRVQIALDAARGTRVPAREGAPRCDAQGCQVHQCAAVRRVQGQDRRLQHVQPGRRHGAPQPVDAHARLLWLPGAGVCHDGSDDR
ncbi:hypothetical protein GUJ93_ZPchr0004g40012 [Zizania palustris]|uniref:Protein kinase domain-containing protein n=1 Tax=Zizania palustris TaxID=103762 RepID=A0A8J5SQH4_ZIZPA|nr:hypothetical protein GUJ93_ZPchr0004g40012 [Zizania palustris]KAG8065080.1 hypothetical protein GUJ93_ZPchr0004g40012 [Zizania palustris]